MDLFHGCLGDWTQALKLTDSNYHMSAPSTHLPFFLASLDQMGAKVLVNEPPPITHIYHTPVVCVELDFCIILVFKAFHSTLNQMTWYIGKSEKEKIHPFKLMKHGYSA